jgi:prepilin-type N-terminal cleavage/methylation domain-containing protein
MRQKGFTLLEIMVVMAVGGILMTGIVVSIFQVVSATSRSNSHGVALTDVSQAALYLKKDFQMAQSTDMGFVEDPVVVLLSSENVTLEWTDSTTPESEEEQMNHHVTYSLSDNGVLERAYDGIMPTMIIGRHITYLRFTQLGESVVNIVITATGTQPQQYSKTIEFSVYMRSVGLPQ